MTVAPVIGEHDHQHSDNIICIICGDDVPLSLATAGSLYADGHQAFACHSHFDDRTQWIIAWALFDSEQSVQLPVLEFA